MKFDRNFFERKWVANSLAAVIGVTAYMLLSHIHLFGRAVSSFMGFVQPVFFGIIIAYVLDPLTKLFERYFFAKVEKPARKRMLSVVCTLVLIGGLIILLLVALIPQLINSIFSLMDNVNMYAITIHRLLGNLGNTTAETGIDISGLISSGREFLENFLRSLPSNVNNIINTSMHVGSTLFSLVIAFIMAIYFMMGKERLLTWISNLLKLILSEKSYKNSAEFWQQCNTILIRYIVGDVLDGLIVGIANSIFMLIAGLPYNVLISVVVGLTNLAPTFGPIAGAVFGGIILFLVNPWYCLWFLIFTVILQTVDGYIIKPRLFGNTLGVSALWILICIVVGGRMFGVAGILFAIPAAAIMDYIFHKGILVALERRKDNQEQREKEKIEMRADLQEVLRNEIRDEMESKNYAEMRDEVKADLKREIEQELLEEADEEAPAAPDAGQKPAEPEEFPTQSKL